MRYLRYMMTAAEILEMFNYLRSTGCRISVLTRVERAYSEALVREWEAQQ